MTRRAGALLVAVPAAFLLASYAWPVLSLLRRSVEGTGWSVVTETLGSARVRRLAVASVAQAGVSTALTLAIGLPCAYAHARFRAPGRRASWIAVAVPFVLPTVVISSGFRALVGAPSGTAARWALVVAAHVVVNLAVVVRTVAVRVATVDPHLEEVARLAGRSRLRAALATLRAAAPAAVSAAVVVFLFCLTSFGIVVVLGGGPVSTVEVEVWFQTTQLLRLDVAAVLAVVQLAVVAAVLTASQRWTGRRAPVPGARVHPPRRPDSAGTRAFAAGAVAVQAAAAVVPLGALVVRSLRVGDGWGLDHYRHLGDALEGTGLAASPWVAIRASLLVGAVAAAIALGVGVPAAVAVAQRRRGARVLDVALLLPLATSAATVGFGILVAYGHPPLDLRGSLLALPLVEATVAAPLVARALLPVLRDLDRRQLDAAALLGAGPLRRLREVALPVLRPAIAVAAGLAFAVSLGEFGATAFLARSGSPTLPQLLVRLLGRPGEANLGQAMAVGVVMAVVTAGVFAAIEALGRGRALEF